MQCPACGYDPVDDEAWFCPNCRYQFRGPEPGETGERSPPYEPEPEAWQERDGDAGGIPGIRGIQVQLLQPALMVMLASAAILYLASGQVAGLAFTFASFEIRYGAFLCLVTGAIIGWIFYRIVLFRIR
jgi:hypothetical protein